MAKESKEQHDIRANVGSEPGVVLYRNQVGLAKYNVDGREFQVPYGLCKGSSDLIGWRSLVITPEMVGQTFARFVAIEVKGTLGKRKYQLRPEQKLFLSLVERSGGLAGVARSEEDARRILGL